MAVELKPVLIIVLLAMVGCGRHEKPNFEYMIYSPAHKFGEAGALRLPVKGTIPRKGKSYSSKAKERGWTEENAENHIKNPLERKYDVLASGNKAYGIYCMVCHGRYGEGDGSIIPKFPKPPSLQSNAVNSMKDAKLFHIISMGRNAMPAYASQVSAEDRWAIVHYLRVLFRAKHASPEDVQKAKYWRPE
jgi:mono/diheme cytochrome c family protein